MASSDADCDHISLRADGGGGMRAASLRALSRMHGVALPAGPGLIYAVFAAICAVRKSPSERRSEGIAPLAGFPFPIGKKDVNFADISEQWEKDSCLR